MIIFQHITCNFYENNIPAPVRTLYVYITYIHVAFRFLRLILVEWLSDETYLCLLLSSCSQHRETKTLCKLGSVTAKTPD